MSLNNLLAALAENSMLYIEITETIEKEETVLIGFEAPGWEALSAELLARQVDKVFVDCSSIIANVKIHLAADN